jgi:hypothetical protein
MNAPPFPYGRTPELPPPIAGEGTGGGNEHGASKSTEEEPD